MMSFLRNSLALLLAALLAIPTTGSEGGENAGGTGVWILPACASVSSLAAPIAQPRMSFTATGTQHDLQMLVSSGMGQASAVLLDDLTGLPVACPVAGKIVRVSAAVLQALQQSSKPTAQIVISDSSQLGYVLHLEARSNGTVHVTVE